MKLLLFTILILTYVVTNAATNLNSTDMTVTVPPSEAQLNTARAILAEALEAKKAGNTKLFLEKLELAKKFQEPKRVKKTFKAAFITMYDTTKINYFSNDEIRYEVNIESTCFNGEVDEALALLEVAIETAAIGSDELWYENPRAKQNKLILDLVDGPNDLRNQVSVKACR